MKNGLMSSWKRQKVEVEILGETYGIWAPLPFFPGAKCLTRGDRSFWQRKQAKYVIMLIYHIIMMNLYVNKKEENITCISSMLALLWLVSSKTLFWPIKQNKKNTYIRDVMGEKIQTTELIVAAEKIPLLDELPLSFQQLSIGLLQKRRATHEPESEI